MAQRAFARPILPKFRQSSVLFQRFAVESSVGPAPFTATGPLHISTDLVASGCLSLASLVQVNHLHAHGFGRDLQSVWLKRHAWAKPFFYSRVRTSQLMRFNCFLDDLPALAPCCIVYGYQSQAFVATWLASGIAIVNSLSVREPCSRHR